MKLSKFSDLAFFSIFSFFLLLFAKDAFAVAYQIFPNMNYNNPAAISMINNLQLIIGDTHINVNRQFKGTVGPRYGTTTSRSTNDLPYGRVAARLTPKVVIGLDILEPGFADFSYPTNSILASATTVTTIKVRDIVPKVSFQLVKQLAWGIGADIANLYQTELSFVLPRGELSNTGKTYAYGWNTGLLYTPRKGTLIGLSYYSKLIFHIINGHSQLGLRRSNSLKATIPLPPLYVLNLTQFLTPKWSVLATLRYAQWSVLQNLVVQNTVIGNLSIPLHYRNGWGGQLGTAYQITDYWMVLGAIAYDQNIVPTIYRGPGLAPYSSLVPSVGVEYNIMKQAKVKLIYSHGFSKPNINTPGSTGPIIGNMNSHANMLDLSLTWNV